MQRRPGRPYHDVDDDDPAACKTTFHTSTSGATVEGTAEIVYTVVWWSTLDPTRRPLGEIPSPAPATFTYRVRGIEAVGRG